jgi:uncharacterized protein YqjF (DUF2071 family)
VSVQKPIFVIHTRVYQKLLQLFAERFNPVVLQLIKDVLLHACTRCRAHRERAISLLPRKFTQIDLVTHPQRRRFLQFAQEIRQAMRCPQSNKKVYVICHTADPLRDSTKAGHGATEVFVQSFAPRIGEQRRAVFCGKYDVVMQSEKRRWHGEAGRLASLQDASLRPISSGGIAGAQPPANRFHASGMTPANCGLRKDRNPEGTREPPGNGGAMQCDIFECTACQHPKSPHVTNWMPRHADGGNLRAAGWEPKITPCAGSDAEGIKAIGCPEASKRSDAGGITTISRWLRSKATTPPVPHTNAERIPEGCQRAPSEPLTAHPARCWHPFRMHHFHASHPVVSLRSTGARSHAAEPDSGKGAVDTRTTKGLRICLSRIRSLNETTQPKVSGNVPDPLLPSLPDSNPRRRSPAFAVKIDRIAPTQHPGRSPVQHQRWQDLLFLHWPVPVGVLRPLLPEALEIDTFGGSAFVGLVPFRMVGVRPVWFPAVPGISNFEETNVRTYVHLEGRNPGVWFFSLDAASRVAVWIARTFWKLPYHFSRMSMGVESSGEIRYRMQRLYPGPVPAGAQFQYRPTGTPSAAIPGSLEHFLAERYILYTGSTREGLQIGRVHHAPYPLQPVDLLEWDESLLAAAGIQRPELPPLAHFARGVDVNIFPLRRI